MRVMGIARTKLRAWAQLLRLPNLFTAIADPLAGWLIAGREASPQLAGVLGGAACLYSAGIVLNDCFDYAEDLRDRPERPLPSGQVARPAAWITGWGLWLVGLGLTWQAGHGLLGLVLAALILFYDAGAKHSLLLGVLSLAGCRFTNFTLGLGSLDGLLWLAPSILGGYVAVLSLLARRETVKPALQRIVRLLLLNLIVLDAALVAVFSNRPVAALWVLALWLPAWALSRILKMT
jgi:4-hydroxybenzoate polyprenyltransferase